MSAVKTPGYTTRLEIWFQANKRGQKVAYRFSHGACRAIRMNLTEAELLIATGQADLLPGHPFKA